MKDTERMNFAERQLDRVLGFLPRVESKISGLFAVNIGMLALLAMNAAGGDLHVWYLVVLYVLAIGLVGWSIVELYRASFPQLEGGAGSLIYFREIAARTESDYIKAALAADEELLAEQLLAQVWRNSEIARKKFDCAKSAFRATALALVPWLGALLGASLQHATLVVK